MSMASNRKQLIDEAASDRQIAPIQFDISSYGADYDVEGLVKRLQRGDIFIPAFQRNYVWSLREASRFIESLLLGLPVPAIFLAREPENNRLLVIDGQQRLKSLQFFYDGFFNPKAATTQRTLFRLVEVQNPFLNKTYAELEEKDRIRLNDSLIHAIVVKQESPAGDDTSIFHIFERLNSEGRKLTEQEIRSAVCHGLLIDSLAELNELKAWRTVFGKPNNRLKDEELILRFIALYEERSKYERPMAEFLTKFATRHREPTPSQLQTWREAFSRSIEIIHEAKGRKAFRPERSLNAAVFDAVSVGLAERLKRAASPDTKRVAAAYDQLLQDKEFISATERSTSDASNVSTRIAKAVKAFSAC
jgi:uncharacterized protein with ParB-like and HNH nuclease domain